jgi:hypothetical protein
MPIFQTSSRPRDQYQKRPAKPNRQARQQAKERTHRHISHRVAARGRLDDARQSRDNKDKPQGHNQSYNQLAPASGVLFATPNPESQVGQKTERKGRSQETTSGDLEINALLVRKCLCRLDGDGKERPSTRSPTDGDEKQQQSDHLPIAAREFHNYAVAAISISR